MKKLLFISKLIILSAITLTSCKKENAKHPDETEFCSFISKGNYDDAGAAINKYLSGQKKNISEDEKLAQLKDWLQEKNCVSDVKIICNSCIYTNPAQSEFEVRFMVDSQEIAKIFDVIMDNPLRFRTFHDE